MNRQSARRAFLAQRKRCLDCGIDTTASGDWYMVEDAVWAASGLSPVDGALCVADLEQRIGRPLVTTDFKLTSEDNRESWGGDRMVPRWWARARPGVGIDNT